MIRSCLRAAAFAALLTSGAAHEMKGGEAAVTGGDATTALVFDHALPNVPGKSLRAVLVTYGPGGASPAYTHAKSAFITATVLEGAIRSRVNDGPERVYRAGESFTEMPGDRHPVSANASATEPARLLAVFVLDSDETVLTTPVR
ncbi:cupin domain-containing protein [Methylorubrum extorquens]|uniref:Cupin domain-containing protein n=1 Tax=Methylorubrum extorquens TaxID=408 RepID=A0AAX3W9P6_METEX|nr:cupin domain-containing protein [Methylorubrum extorquens]WHQ68100.1 cupin domain-containing protein [Methylorubrum extorquens]